MNAKLIHGENYIIIEDFIYSKEDEVIGNLYNVSFKLKIRSGEFCGIGPCEYDINKFRVFISELGHMYNFKKDIVILEDISYGSCVRFILTKTGQLEISGEVFGHAREHSVKFEFTADQTSLKSFVEQLERI